MVRFDLGRSAAVAVGLLLWQASGLQSASLLGHEDPKPDGLVKGVVGFWHVGKGKTGGPASRDVVIRTMLRELKGLPIWGKVRINYLDDNDAIAGEQTRAMLQSEPSLFPFPVSGELEPHGKKHILYEWPTLHRLWEHCQANPGDLVFYIHTKSRGQKRWWYMINLFKNPAKTVELLRNGSWVYSATNCLTEPFCHSGGNFWWARCDHVRRLNNPFSPEFLEQGAGNYFDNPPSGRYWAEYWLLSDYRGKRPEPASKTGGRHAWRKTANACLHPAHGDICDHISLARNEGGQTWTSWKKTPNLAVVPWDISREHLS